MDKTTNKIQDSNKEEVSQRGRNEAQARMLAFPESDLVPAWVWGNTLTPREVAPRKSIYQEWNV